MLKQQAIIKQNSKFKDIGPTIEGNNFNAGFVVLPRPSYPDFRFSCPNCGTLDVLVQNQSFDFIQGNCLDCKTTWKEEYFN